MKKILIVLLLCIIPVFGWSTIIEAESVSYADVNTAYGLCSDGDTLKVPAGTATWSSLLTIEKSITIQGAGIASTIITANSSTQDLMRISAAGLGSDKPVRITGICFKDGRYQVFVLGFTGLDYPLTKVRIDHNKFWRESNGTDNLRVGRWVEGLIDHNEFLNCNRAIFCWSWDNNDAWARYYSGGVEQAGTSHALFIEDNTFTQDSNGISGLHECIYHQEGARTVIRYNTFDGENYNYDFCPFDSHGNQNLYDGVADFRGQPLLEVYENTFKYDKTYRVCYIRGGSVLFYNNAFTYLTSSSGEIVVTEEEAWQTNWFDPVDTVWPAEDQIMNSFFWGNTRNGSPITSVTISGAGSSTFIQEDRDYFMHAPQSSGGYEYYDDRPGAAGNGTDGTLNFSGSGANVYYPYTPYTYPHPLQGFKPNIFVHGIIFTIWPSLVPMIWFALVAWFCIAMRMVNKL